MTTAKTCVQYIGVDFVESIHSSKQDRIDKSLEDQPNSRCACCNTIPKNHYLKTMSPVARLDPTIVDSFDVHRTFFLFVIATRGEE